MTEAARHRFSLLARTRAADRLARYVEQQLRQGRRLDRVLADRFVGERLSERPYLADDLAVDQRIREASAPVRREPAPLAGRVAAARRQLRDDRLRHGAVRGRAVASRPQAPAAR